MSPSTIRRLHVDEFLRLKKFGILEEDERVELISGVLYQRGGGDVRRALLLAQTIAALSAAVAGRALVLTGVLLRLGPYDAREPDITIVAPGVADYERRPVLPAEVLAAIDVGGEQREREMASAGIVQYVRIDDDLRRIIDVREPDAQGYARRSRLRPGERLTLAAIAAASVPVDGIFGTP